MTSAFRPALAAIATAALFAAWPAQASLVALYQYDTPGAIGRDSSGNGNHLISSGGAVAGVGKYGGGLELNGSGAMLVTPNRTLVGLPSGGSSYTVSTWFNADTAGIGGLIGWGNYGSNSQVIALRANGAYALHSYWWANDLTGDTGVDITSGSGADGWHFAAVTYDAATHLNNMYFDGALIASREAYGLNAGTANFAVGRTVGNEFWDGQLDNTAIFNEALSATQLGTVMRNDFSAFDVSAVPEPGSLPLAAVALGLLALTQTVNRRRSGPAPETARS